MIQEPIWTWISRIRTLQSSMSRSALTHAESRPLWQR